MFDRLFEVLQWALEALIPFVIVHQFERAALLRLGRFVRILDPGFHWCLPLHFDQVYAINVVPRTEHLTGLSTTTIDGKSIGFDAVITYRVHDAEKAILEVEDLKDAVADTCAGQIGTTLAACSWETIWKGNAVDELTKVCRARGWRWGIEILSVQLAGAALVKNIRLSHSAGDAAARVGL